MFIVLFCLFGRFLKSFFVFFCATAAAQLCELFDNNHRVLTIYNNVFNFLSLKNVFCCGINAKKNRVKKKQRDKKISVG